MEQSKSTTDTLICHFSLDGILNEYMLQQNRDENDWEPAPVFSFLSPSGESRPLLCTLFNIYRYRYIYHLHSFPFTHILQFVFRSLEICSHICIYTDLYILSAYMCIYLYLYRPSTFIFKYYFVFLHMNISRFLLILSHDKKNVRYILGSLFVVYTTRGAWGGIYAGASCCPSVYR